MIFFVFYTAYENLYRKTSFLLCLFTSAFIIGQYYYSLFWKLDLMSNEEINSKIYKSLKWQNIIPIDANSRTDPFDQYHPENGVEAWYKQHSLMYLEQYPVIEDWAILICMGFLQDVNSMFLETHSITGLSNKILNKFNQNNAKLLYYFKRTKRITEMVLSMTSLIILIALIMKIQINLINWIYFCQTILLVGLKLRASNSPAALT
jgi:hypothetical protein